MSIGISAALGAEVERLRNEAAEAQAVKDSFTVPYDYALLLDENAAMREEIGELRAELAEAKRDAERYRRLCSLVAWGTLGVCRVAEAGDDYADDGVMLDAWLDDPEMIAEAQGIDAAMAGGE